MTAPADVRDVLAAHRLVAKLGLWRCVCDDADNPIYLDEHNAHLADVLDVWAREQRAQALREFRADIEQRLDGFPRQGRSTRARWVLAVLDTTLHEAQS